MPMKTRAMVGRCATGFLVALLVATQVEARSNVGQDLAAYRMAAFSKDGWPVIVEVSVTDKRWLIVEIESFTDTFDFRNPTKIRTRRWRIAPALYDDLLEDIGFLRGAALTGNRKTGLVCLGIDFHTETTGNLMILRPTRTPPPEMELQVVLGAVHCSTLSWIVPTHPLSEARAIDLRAKLKALGAQRAGRRLRELRD